MPQCFFELGDLIARISELAADFLRLRFNLSDLFGSEVALHFEAPQISEQGSLLAGKRIGLALQCDHAVVGPAGLRLGPRTVVRLRCGRRHGQQDNERVGDPRAIRQGSMAHQRYRLLAGDRCPRRCALRRSTPSMLRSSYARRRHRFG